MRLFIKAKRAQVGATSADGKRKKVAEGKWTSVSGKDDGMVTVPFRNQRGVSENIKVKRSDPIAQTYLKKKSAASARKKAISMAVKKLTNMGIHSVEDIDKQKKASESRFNVLVRIVGQDAADHVMRELEVRQWEPPEKGRK